MSEMDVLSLAYIELEKANARIEFLSKETQRYKNKCFLASVAANAKEQQLKECRQENVELHIKLAKQKAINNALKAESKPSFNSKAAKLPQPIGKKQKDVEHKLMCRDVRLNDPQQKITRVIEKCGSSKEHLKTFNKQNNAVVPSIGCRDYRLNDPKVKLTRVQGNCGASTNSPQQKCKPEPQIEKPVQMNGYLLIPASFLPRMPGWSHDEVSVASSAHHDFRLNKSASNQTINRMVINTKDEYEHQLTTSNHSKKSDVELKWGDFEYDNDEKINFQEILEFKDF
uniref:Uncharacterized protein n=1 Tax=Clytia hemisphaerica TaxID=252671 RepID=A0A7M6DNG0_9CNID